MQPEDFQTPANEAKSKARKRPCMSCRKLFESEGIHNRICDNCKRRGRAPDAYLMKGRSNG